MTAEVQYYDTHYAEMAEQPIERMQRVLSHEEFIGFLKGNCIKYEMRAGHKLGEPRDKDISKYNRYLEWLSKAIRGEYINPKE
jgi:hypothetical protein